MEDTGDSAEDDADRGKMEEKVSVENMNLVNSTVEESQELMRRDDNISTYRNLLQSESVKQRLTVNDVQQYREKPGSISAIFKEDTKETIIHVLAKGGKLNNLKNICDLSSNNKEVRENLVNALKSKDIFEQTPFYHLVLQLIEENVLDLNSSVMSLLLCGIKEASRDFLKEENRIFHFQDKWRGGQNILMRLAADVMDEPLREVLVNMNTYRFALLNSIFISNNLL